MLRYPYAYCGGRTPGGRRAHLILDSAGLVMACYVGEVAAERFPGAFAHPAVRKWRLSGSLREPLARHFTALEGLIGA